jgi:putative ABC transport system permease protein
VRAARTSTVHALADAARPPRRTPWLIAISARLPVPLLLGLRVAARRPRRVVLSAASIAVTVSGVVAMLAARAQIHQDAQLIGGTDPNTVRANQVLLVITVTLVALAAVNAVFVTWATALDAKHSSALARPLGATPQQVSSGLSVAQVLPALAGAALGHPRRPRTLRRHRRRRRRGDRPAALAAPRRGTGDRARRGDAHHHPARLGARPTAEILHAELA